VHKHIAGVKYEEISIPLGLNMTAPVYDWVAEFTKGSEPSRNGAMVTTDADLNMKTRLDFTNARITEVAFPLLDAASKTAVHMTLKWQPEATRLRTVTGKLTPPATGTGKAWLPGNFRLTIPPLDCTRVGKIDAWPSKVNPAGKIEVGPLGFTLPEAFAKTWRTYFDGFVLRNSGKELTGKLEVLNTALDTTLATIDFGHMGIFMLDPERPSGDGIRRLKAEMYCEEFAFSWAKV
jgi:hypothetical protein